MKILQILGDSKYGGSTYLAIEWAAFLLEQGCEVDVHSTDPTSIAALRARPGIRVIDDIHIPREVALIQDMRALLWLTRFIRRERYDIVHTGMTTAGFVGRLAAWLARTPVIVHDAQGWPATEFSPPLEKAIFTPLSYLAGLISTRVMCAGHGTAALAKQLHTCPAHKLTVICNGIDPAPFVAASQNGAGLALRRELGIDEQCIVIGNANRLAPQKDNASLIRAMAHLESLLPTRPWVLLLAGDGPERPMLEALTRDLGLTERVRFLGFRQDIPALLAATDIFVNTSLWEGLSISLLEAMAAARPIVTTSILPNAELIEHETTGLLVAPRSPIEVAHSIDRLIHEPELAQRCAQAARHVVLRHYTIERRLNEIWQLYTRLLATATPTSEIIHSHIVERSHSCVTGKQH
jgi:glycosyltransferase involved in cell wall biosynthesis